jgi:glucosyl-dolichyl phosphate glucuronosyltransferase
VVDVSIIIPTFNRASALARTLKSVAEAVPPNASVEFIIVDNGSTDRTVEAFNNCAKFHNQEWRYFYEPMPGLLSGRHKGAAEARGEILSFLDDDVLLAPSWLDALQEAFADPTVALVGGPSRPSYEVEPPHWLEGLWWHSDDGGKCFGPLSLIDLGSSVRSLEADLVWGLNYSVRRTVFWKCGGSHPDYMPEKLQRYSGDGECGLSLKIKDNGLRVLYHPGAAVTHVIPASRLTPKYLEQRAFFQGVIDSYTQIRRERRVPPAPVRTWKDLFRPMKWRAERMMFLRNPTTKRIRRLIARAHYDGTQFHRNEVRQDPTLLEWVLRNNYFDYRLPAGWEALLSTREAVG